MQRAPVYSIVGRKVWVAGHTGMVGSAIARRLKRESCELLFATHAALDLRRPNDVANWLDRHRPQVVVLAAAKVGGIWANNEYPFEFLYDNLMIEANVIKAAFDSGVEKLLFLGSSCIYPKMAPQPIKEEYLLEGALEPTNEWYAVAKIAGIKLCQSLRRQYGADFISAMPCNLYGPGDNFDLKTSHVLPALVRKFHEAKIASAETVDIWGSGTPYREFMHVDDLADACAYLLQHYSGEQQINVGTGRDVTIRELAATIADVIGYKGGLVFDPSKPDGTPRKLLDVTRLANLGWTSKIDLNTGIAGTYEWFSTNVVSKGSGRPAAVAL